MLDKNPDADFCFASAALLPSPVFGQRRSETENFNKWPIIFDS